MSWKFDLFCHVDIIKHNLNSRTHNQFFLDKFLGSFTCSCVQWTGFPRTFSSTSFICSCVRPDKSSLTLKMSEQWRNVQFLVQFSLPAVYTYERFSLVQKLAKVDQLLNGWNSLRYQSVNSPYCSWWRVRWRTQPRIQALSFARYSKEKKRKEPGYEVVAYWRESFHVFRVII